jgi:hypothetical protein
VLWESVAVVSTEKGTEERKPRTDEEKVRAHAITLIVAALKAIDEKNASALSDVGGAIDEACENCHTKYWYPTAPAPPSTIPAPPADPAKTQ